MRVGSNAQTTLLWNKRHFPTTKHTWRTAEAQQQSRLIPLTQTAVPTRVTRAGLTPIFPQLGPMLTHAVVLHVCHAAAAAATESWIRHQGSWTSTQMCTRRRASRNLAQEPFESGETQSFMVQVTFHQAEFSLCLGPKIWKFRLHKGLHVTDWGLHSQ